MQPRKRPFAWTQEQVCYRREGGDGRSVLFVSLHTPLWEAQDKMPGLSVGVILFKATLIYYKSKVELIMTN